MTPTPTSPPARRPAVAKGQRYRVTQELRVIVMTEWTAPYTGGYERTLSPGVQFVITSNPGPWASSVFCDPDDARALARALIPWRDRWRLWVYRGFFLCVQLPDLDRCCERLDFA